MAKLRVWMKAGHTVEIIRRMLPGFTDESGIEVELDVVPERTAHDSLVRGDVPADVVTVPFWYLEELVSVGMLRPLALEQLGMSDEAFEPRALQCLTRQGSLWAAPHTLTGAMLAYRQDVFEREGLNMPSTLGDVLQAHRQLRGHGLAVRCNPEFSSLETFAGWAAAKGIKLLPDSGVASLDDLEAGIGDLVQAMSASDRRLTTLDYAGTGALVEKGSASLLFDTSAWSFQFEAPGSPVRGRMAYTGIAEHAPAQFLYAEGLGITAGCRDEPAARQFIAWRHSERVLRAEVEGIRRIDIPRVDLRGKEWFIDYVQSQGLSTCLAAVDRSWASTDDSHVAKRADYVTAARTLMEAISGTISGRFSSLTEAHEITYGQRPLPE